MRLPLERPVLVVILSLLMILVFGAGASKLEINADTRVFFSDKNEQRQALDMFEARYSRRTGLLVVVHADDGDLFTTERLERVASFTEAAWRLPYATRVESYTNAVHITSDAEGIVVTEMFDTTNGETPEDIRDRVTADNLLRDRLISADGTTGGIAVTVNYPMASSAATSEILEAAHALAEESGLAEAGLEVWYGGRVASSNAFSAAAKNDLKTLTPLSWLAIGIFVFLLTRSPAITLSLIGVALGSIICAMGLAGWTGIQINAATASAPTIILCVTVASLMHLLTALQSRRYLSDEVKPALDGAIRENIRPVSIALGTTIVGFMTLNWADAPPMRQIGTLTASGVLFSWIFAFSLLPALLTLSKPKPRAPLKFIQAALDRLTNFVLARSKAILMISPVVVLALGFGVTRIEIDDNLVHFFDESFDYRQQSDLIQQNLTGLDYVEFDLAGPEENAALSPEYFDKLERFEAWLRNYPKVDHVHSLSEIFKRLNRHLNDGEARQHVLPTTQEEFAQYLLIYEMSLPFGQSMTDQISIDRRASRVTAIMRDATTKEVRLMRERAEEWLRTETPVEIAGPGTGLAVMYAYLSSLNVKFMIGGTLVALLLVSVFLVFAFRSVKYGAISLLPNLMPVFMAFGLWGLMVGEVGIAVASVGASTLGLIVDDTVHLVWRYLQARRNGDDARSAVRQMLRVVGSPMLISTLTLGIGYAIVATSHFHISASLGALSLITILFALVADWLILPSLLLALDGRRSSAPAHSRENVFARQNQTAPAQAEKEVA